MSARLQLLATPVAGDSNCWRLQLLVTLPSRHNARSSRPGAGLPSAFFAPACTCTKWPACCFLPVAQAARAGAKVIVVEPCVPLAAIVREAAAENAVRIAVVPQLSYVRQASLARVPFGRSARVCPP